jgi:hypothetical protein
LPSNALKGHSLYGDTSSCNAYQKPKLPIFSGEEKSETSFDVWKLEVKCVLREELLLLAMMFKSQVVLIVSLFTIQY